MEDIIFQKFFEPERWAAAIEKGVDKDIRRDQLIQLCHEGTRISIAKAVKEGKYKISPPHTARIPKENGEYRTVYINEPVDRVFLSIANDLLFELMPERIHTICKSYQKGIGCGAVVKKMSETIVEMNLSGVIGVKADFSKYFDTVPLKFIDDAFCWVEDKYGVSAIIDVLRDYYHCDLYFDQNNELQSKYQSLKQGCAVASWLADVIPYRLDERLSQLPGYVVRYSDDVGYIGSEPERAIAIMEEELGSMDMALNPKKVELLTDSKWFKFLGYSIKGDMISLSKSRIKTFQKEIESRTIKCPKTTFRKAINAVNNYLYRGDGEFSWATQVLPVCNVQKDIDELNKFVMDCLRAVETGKKKVGGLGYVVHKADGCISRGTGKNVTMNRIKIGEIEGYLTLGCMRNALLTSRSVYNTLVANL